MEFMLEVDKVASEARAIISSQAASLSLSELEQLLTVVRICEDAKMTLADLEVRVENARQQLDSIKNGTATQHSDQVMVLHTVGQQGKEKPKGGKLAGQTARSEFADHLRQRSIHLARTGQRTFQTSDGRKVGVAYASEVSERPDKWWLGLPDEHFDVAVLLCRDLKGELLEFIFPSSFVSQIWQQLSKNASQRIFHVLRTGPNYELTDKVSPSLKHITQYLRKYDAL